MRKIDHKGAHYQVKGSAQPAAIAAGPASLRAGGSSDTGRKFAARHAEAVFTAHMEQSTAKAFYEDLKNLVVAAGAIPRTC